MRPCGEAAVSIALKPSVLPPMYWAAASLSTDCLELRELSFGRFRGGEIRGVFGLGRC